MIWLHDSNPAQAAALAAADAVTRRHGAHIPKLLQSIIGINELINTYYRPSNNR